MDDLGALGSSVKACLQKPAPVVGPRPGPARERLCDLLNLQQNPPKHGRQAPLAASAASTLECSGTAKAAVAVQQHPPRMPGKNLLPAGAPGSVIITTGTIEVSQRGSRSGGPRPGQSWSKGFGLTQWRIDANRLMRGSPSDGGICETVFLHILSTIDVPQINHHRASHQIP